MAIRPNTISHTTNTTNLGDLLERVLDKGVVIMGDIKIKLVDVELLSIQIRLLICSVEKAQEIGVDWWAHQPTLPAIVPPSLETMIERMRPTSPEPVLALPESQEDILEKIVEEPAIALSEPTASPAAPAHPVAAVSPAPPPPPARSATFLANLSL